MSGPAPRGGDILGMSPKKGSDDIPYSILSYVNGPGYRPPNGGKRYDFSEEDTSKYGGKLYIFIFGDFFQAIRIYCIRLTFRYRTPDIPGKTSESSLAVLGRIYSQASSNSILFRILWRSPLVLGAVRRRVSRRRIQFSFFTRTIKL